MTNLLQVSRRTFFVSCAALGAFAMTGLAAAQAALVKETDPQAAALGYKTSAANVDHSKYPKYVAGQACSACQLYQGKATDPSGPCPIFAGKQVSATGWCSAYVKKA